MKINLSPLQLFLGRVNIKPCIRDRHDDSEGNGCGDDGVDAHDAFLSPESKKFFNPVCSE